MSTAPPFDLDAYLDRIGWRGPTAPTHDTLAGVLGAHMAAIPFENLDVLLGRGVRLDLEGLQAKLVRARRGGYCFEHASLLKAALERLGFHPVAHAARVVLFAPRTESPRTHMFLTVPLPGTTYVLDPGFGVLAPRVPVPLRDGAEVAWGEHGEERHRMVREGDLWVLRAQRGPEMVDAWVTALSHENPIDFELANFYTHASPRSPFTSRLMLRALTPDGRVSVMNRDVTVTRGREATTSRLADRAELRALLARWFGFDVPEVLGMKVGSEPEWA